MWRLRNGERGGEVEMVITLRRTVVETVTSDVDDAEHWHCDLLSRRWDTRKQPVDRAVVGHTENELVCEIALSIETNRQEKKVTDRRRDQVLPFAIRFACLCPQGY